MNAIVATPKPITLRQFANRRLAREWKTVMAMMQIYCRDKHGKNLCAECQGLANYVHLRLDRCRFGEDKPTCANCPVHCYQRDRREQIKSVMRYAGPKMLWEHPLLSIGHLLDGWFGKPAEMQTPNKSGACRQAEQPAPGPELAKDGFEEANAEIRQGRIQEIAPTGEVAAPPPVSGFQSGIVALSPSGESAR